MRNTLLTLIGLFGVVFSFGQEEGSADLFTESYTDRFQEVFFEALKQKGIGNYDRAEALLQDAKAIDPINPVLDFELARVLLLQKRYAEAESYAFDALKAEPSEYWFLETFMLALKGQSKGMDAYLPQFSGPESFHLNLARWYISEELWEQAADQLTGMPDSDEVLQLRTLLASKRTSAGIEQIEVIEEKHTGDFEEGSVGYYETELRELLEEANWPVLQEVSGEAMEVYPLQPYFYYAHGISLIKQGKMNEAVTVLESGEGMLLGNSKVSGQIYAALVEAHTALGNTDKAGHYRNKLKSGS